MSGWRQRFERQCRKCFVPLAGVVFAAGPSLASFGTDFDPEQVFVNRCSACHTVGQGPRIGPDLAAVTTRRETDWLIAFIQSSQDVIASGDPVARQLFEQFNRQRMPDHELAPESIRQLLAYIEEGGPGEPVPQIQPAVDADSVAIQRGRELFTGRQALADGGVACASCHSLDRASVSTRFLGGSLVRVFSKYQDVELASTIEGARFAAGFSVPHQPLVADDSFAIRGFLRQVDLSDTESSAWVRAYPALGIGLGVLVFGVCAIVGRLNPS